MINDTTVQLHRDFELTEHPQSLNTNSDNLRSKDIRFESNVVNPIGTEAGDDHSFADSKQVIEPMSIAKTETEYEQRTLSSSTPWNDVLTKDEKMCPKSVQQSIEFVADLSLNDEQSLLSSSMDLKTSTGDSLAVDDEEMSPNKQPKKWFIVNASIDGQESMSDDQKSPNILPHPAPVDNEEIASVYSDCRMYSTESDSGHDSLADILELEPHFDEQQSIHGQGDEENVSTYSNGQSESDQDLLADISESSSADEEDLNLEVSQSGRIITFSSHSNLIFFALFVWNSAGITPLGSSKEMFRSKKLMLRKNNRVHCPK